jgi:ketosteroid isomerase-like protein
MSRENVEVVRSVYEAFNRRDWDAAFRDQSADVELTTRLGPNAGTYRGREECQAYFQELLTPFAALSAEPEEFFERGDLVVAFVKTRARPKDTRAEIEVRNGHLWAFQDGKVVSLQTFPQPEKALEAARLRD